MAELLSARIPAFGEMTPSPASDASTGLIRSAKVVSQAHVVPPAELRQDAVTPNRKTCPGCASTGSRNLVVCIDGTSNQFSTKNTNVVELYSRLIKDKDQLTFYNSGIGTYAKPSYKSPSYWKQVIANKLDLAFALRLEKIIVSAYAWLVDNYEAGDRIFLFGFSRGAYQVRALAAMIELVGLLHKGNHDQIAFAYELYAASGDEESSRQLPKATKPPPRPTSDVRPSNTRVPAGPSLRERVIHAERPVVETFFRRRAKQVPAIPKPPAISRPRAEGTRTSPMAMQKQFKATFSRPIHVHFVGAWDTVSSVGIVRGKTLPATTEGMKFVCFFRHALALHEYRVKFLPEYARAGHGPDPDQRRTGFAEPHTKEVWFTGSHSDIGGGSTVNTTLDQFGPALRWMSYEAMQAGLRLDNSPPNWGEITVTKSMTYIWRILECLPLKHLSYEDDPKRQRWWVWRKRDSPAEPSSFKNQRLTRRPHFCADRHIKPLQRIHRSVEHECGEFEYPTSVLFEEDAYINANDILPSQEEVLRTGCVLDELTTRRLELLSYSAQGIQSLREVNLVQYIYDTARWCRAVELERAKRILEDLQSLHAAYVNGCFRIDSTGDIAARHPADVADSTSVATFPFHMCGHTDAVSSVAFLTSTRVVTGSRDKTLRTWDAKTGQMTLGNRVSFHSGVTCVAEYAARELVATTSDDSSIHLWTADSRAVRPGKILEDEIWNHIITVAFSMDGAHLVSGSTDCAIRVWNVATGKRMGEPVHGHTEYVRSVIFSPDGTRLVSGSDDHTVRLWEWSPGEAMAQPFGPPLSGHTDAVYSVAFSPDGGTVASGSADASIRLWNAFTRRLERTLEGHTSPVRSVAFAPDGARVVSGSDDWTVRIWDARTGATVQVLVGHTDHVLSVSVSPDGSRIASGSGDKTVRVWDFPVVPDECREDDDVAAAVVQVASM